MEEFSQAMLNTEYLDKTQQQRIQTITDQLSLIQKQGLKRRILNRPNQRASIKSKERKKTYHGTMQ